MSETSEKKVLDGLVSIGELLGETFFVDTYQRGYKWTELEVEELLNDIHTFEPVNDKEFYCLQPIVVRRRVEEGDWELIDGQQRLSTIYMILRVLKATNSFSINYGTRKESAVFLNKFVPSEKYVKWEDYLKTNPLFNGIETIDNIDNYHFFNAFQAINNFFIGQDRKTLFCEKLLKNVQVIWYEPDIKIENGRVEDSRSIFTRINAGKIPLTQAELLKAWFIQNAGSQDKAKYVANKWEEMERQLRVPEFRYFLTGTGSDGNSNWITVLLEDFAGYDKLEERKNLFHILTQNQKAETGLELFTKFELLYDSIIDWFADNEMYNLIGWLRSITDYRLTTIHNEYQKEAHTRSEFKTWIKGLVCKSLNDIKPEMLEYGEDNDAIRRILLSFNILTHSGIALKSRFPFYEYTTRSWDIEHIHALATGIPETVETLLEWLKSYESALEKLGNKTKIKDEISVLLEKLKEATIQSKNDLTFLQNMKNEFGRIQPQVFEILGGETTDSIENLALLNADVNRSIKNSPFVEKRERIKAYIDKGEFLPPATLRVFLKYYSNGNSNSLIWGDEDRSSYRKAMGNLFNEFGVKTLIVKNEN